MNLRKTLSEEAKASVVGRVPRKDSSGKSKHDVVTMLIPSGHSGHLYQFNYPPNTPEHVVQADVAKMTAHAADQAIRQKEHDELLVNKNITAAGKTAYVADCVVHIDTPRRIKLTVNFYIRELRRWETRKYVASSVGGLPTAQTLIADIQSLLRVTA